MEQRSTHLIPADHEDIMKLFQRKPDTTATTSITDEIRTVERVMARYPGRRPLTFGAPTRCPSCGEWGLVDDVRGLAAHNHCYFCAVEWVITVRALRAVEKADAEGGAPIVPIGVRLSDDEDTDALVLEPAKTRAATPPPRLLASLASRPRVQIVGL